MENYIYKGLKINGFVAILIHLCFIAGIILSITWLDKSFDTTPTAAIVLLIVCAFASAIMFSGYKMLEPNESRVFL